MPQRNKATAELERLAGQLNLDKLIDRIGDNANKILAEYPGATDWPFRVPEDAPARAHLAAAVVWMILDVQSGLEQGDRKGIAMSALRLGAATRGLDFAWMDEFVTKSVKDREKATAKAATTNRTIGAKTRSKVLAAYQRSVSEHPEWKNLRPHAMLLSGRKGLPGFDAIYKILREENKK